MLNLKKKPSPPRVTISTLPNFPLQSPECDKVKDGGNDTKNNKNKHKELLDDIESEIVNFTVKGDVTLQGDFNARTGSMQEFAVHDDDNQSLEISEDYEIDTENYLYSKDENTTNSRGRILIDLCTALSLRILNGRVVGDLTGKKNMLQIQWEQCGRLCYHSQ